MPNFCELVLPISAQEPVSNMAVMSWPFAPVFTHPSLALATLASLTPMDPFLLPPRCLAPWSLLPLGVRLGLCHLLREGCPTYNGNPFLNCSPLSALFFSTAFTTIQHMLLRTLFSVFVPTSGPCPPHVSSMRTRILLHSQCLAHSRCSRYFLNESLDRSPYLTESC